jgi:hypothetical protein
MKDLTEIRRNNLLAMINEYRDRVLKGVQHGAMTSFARHLAMNPVQLSQLKNGTAPIGNPLARQIEKKAGKPSLWMDDEHHLINMDDSDQVNFLNVAMKLYRISPSAAKDVIMQAMLDEIERLNQEPAMNSTNAALIDELNDFKKLNKSNKAAVMAAIQSMLATQEQG